MSLSGSRFCLGGHHSNAKELLGSINTITAFCPRGEVKSAVCSRKEARIPNNEACSVGVLSFSLSFFPLPCMGICELVVNLLYVAGVCILIYLRGAACHRSSESGPGPGNSRYGFGPMSDSLSGSSFRWCSRGIHVYRSTAMDKKKKEKKKEKKVPPSSERG